jgi:hypothetical protein
MKYDQACDLAYNLAYNMIYVLPDFSLEKRFSRA